MIWSLQTGRDSGFSGASTGPTVGPGSYNIAGPTSSRGTIRTSRANPHHAFVTPGPGAYDGVAGVSQSVRSGSSCFKSRTDRNTMGIGPNGIPSSADHGSLTRWGNSRRSGSRTLRERSECVNDIGPGSYNPKKASTSARCSAINRIDRQSIWGLSETPGPGEYDVAGLGSRLAISIKGKYEERPRDVIEDRVDDTRVSTGRKRPTSVFSSRVPRAERGIEVSPGPGEYETAPDLWRKGGPKSAFGSRNCGRGRQAEVTPGPSDYVVYRDERAEVTRQSSVFKSKTKKREQQESTPREIGPGTYDPEPKTRRSRTSASFSRSVQYDAQIDAGPSPADYDTSVKSARRSTVRNARYERHGNWLADSNHNPSPDQYVADREMRGKAFSFPKARTVKRRKKESVGPGSYETGPPSMIKSSYNAYVPKPKPLH